MLQKIALSLFLLTSACASINSVSLTPIPADKGYPVQAEVTKWIFLGFNFNNDFIDPLVPMLQAQCQGGVISGILTKDETIAYVLVFKKRVVTTGYCSATKTGVLGKFPPNKEK